MLCMNRVFLICFLGFFLAKSFFWNWIIMFSNSPYAKQNSLSKYSLRALSCSAWIRHCLLIPAWFPLTLFIHEFSSSCLPFCLCFSLTLLIYFKTSHGLYIMSFLFSALGCCSCYSYDWNDYLHPLKSCLSFKGIFSWALSLPLSSPIKSCFWLVTDWL